MSPRFLTNYCMRLSYWLCLTLHIFFYYADANAESPLRLGNNYYVPRDEAFEEVKRDDFMAKSLKGVVHHVMPILANSLKEGNDEFQCFQCIEKLYEDGIGLINFEALDNKILKAFLGTQLLDKMRESSDQISDLFQYAQPHVISSTINYTLRLF